MRETIGLRNEELRAPFNIRGPIPFLFGLQVGSDLFLCGSFAFGRGFGLWSCCQHLTVIGVGLLPKLPGIAKGVDLDALPPGNFIAGLMKLAMMTPTERNGELVADFDS